jgi:hypothetical protein
MKKPLFNLVFDSKTGCYKCQHARKPAKDFLLIASGTLNDLETQAEILNRQREHD